MKVKACGLTDVGKTRQVNEDQFLVAELTKAMRIWHTSLLEPKVQFGDERGHLFLVADGMGGHHGGERASALAVFAIEQFTLNSLKWFFSPNGPEAQALLGQFQKALKGADRQIVEEAAEHPELEGMGTTLTLAYQLDSRLCVLHVGDSRAYVYRDGGLVQLTRDHTLVDEMVRRGDLQPEDVATHRLRHVITNVVGGSDVGVDVEAHAVDLLPADRMLLCSDGLTEMLSTGDIGEILRAHAEPDAACRALVDRANAAGGRDNITVVVAHFEEGDPTTVGL